MRGIFEEAQGRLKHEETENELRTKSCDGSWMGSILEILKLKLYTTKKNRNPSFPGFLEVFLKFLLVYPLSQGFSYMVDLVLSSALVLRFRQLNIHEQSHGLEIHYNFSIIRI